MSQKKPATKHYSIRVEDRIYREGDVVVEATSAAEAAMIALELANNGKVRMRYQDHDRGPAIYRVDGITTLGDLAGTRSNEGCLTYHVEELLAIEGLDPGLAEGLYLDYPDDCRFC